MTPLDAYSQVVTQVAKRLLQSVASVSVARGRRGETGGGSAVVVDDDGLLVTSAHVVAGVSRGGASFSDGAEHPFDVVGTDALSDLAVLRVPDVRLRAAELGDADDLVVGQLVVAVGNPLGYSGSVSAGVVSGLRRSIMTRDGSTARLVEDVIQTDASLHPGNSGGALADAEARVIGISTALVGPSVGQGLGLAVPMNTTTRRIISALHLDGHVVRLHLGVEGGTRPLPPRAAELTGRTHGVEVLGVVAHSPAAASGLRPGDVIVSLAGQAVTSVGELQAQLTGRLPSRIVVALVRGGQLLEVDVEPTVLRS